MKIGSFITGRKSKRKSFTDARHSDKFLTHYFKIVSNDTPLIPSQGIRGQNETITAELLNIELDKHPYTIVGVYSLNPTKFKLISKKRLFLKAI